MADQSGVEWANLRPFDPVAIVLGTCCGHNASHLTTRTDSGRNYIHCAVCGPCMEAKP